MTLPPGFRCSHLASTGTGRPAADPAQRDQRRVADVIDEVGLGAHARRAYQVIAAGALLTFSSHSTTMESSQHLDEADAGSATGAST